MSKSRTLNLDQRNKKFLGVCAGLANYLDVEPWTVRLVFIGGVVFGGWFLIPIYFAAWFLLDDATSSMRSSITDNLAVKHFRTVDYRKKIYRNTRDAKWAGVCAGIADYLEVNVFAVRMIFLVAFFTTGGFSLTFYIAAWIVMDKAPESYYEGVNEPDSSRDSRFDRTSNRWEQGAEARAEASAETATDTEAPRRDVPGLHAGRRSKRREIKYCIRKFTSLQKRLARMEAYVTSSRFKLHSEFRNIQ